MRTGNIKLFLLTILLIGGCKKDELDPVSSFQRLASSNERLALNYNSTFYSSVLNAAKSIAAPFLIQQGYITSTGVTVNGNTLVQDGIVYTVSQSYQNPSTSPLYYLYSADYSGYGISVFSSVWPNK